MTRPLSGSFDVKKVDSVVVVISELEQQNYVSFFNFHIIQNLINKYGRDEDKIKLTAYEAKFKEICKRSVFEVPEAVFGPPPDDGQMLAFKVTERVFHPAAILLCL